MGRLGPSGHPLSPGLVNGGLGPALLAQLDFSFLPKNAMSVIGFSEEEIRQVLEVTALVLKLGNVKLTDEFQANGIPASGVCDAKGWYPEPAMGFLPSVQFSNQLQRNQSGPLPLGPLLRPPPVRPTDHSTEALQKELLKTD